MCRRRGGHGAVFGANLAPKPFQIPGIQVDNMPGAPFDIELPADTPLRRAAAIAARPLLRWALRLNTFGELYRRAETMRPGIAPQLDRDAGAFARLALHVLEIGAEFDPDDLRRIPPHGPLIVAANHPHGALDGLVLLDQISRVRPDVRLIANHLLARVPDLRGVCFFVDPFERHDSTERSRVGLRAAHLWLRRGGAVIVFPAGEVAHARTADGFPVDSPWRTTVGRLATATRARVLPVHISGENSSTFYAAGRVHPLLRSLLLARELLKKRGTSIHGRVGQTLLSTNLAVTEQAASTATDRIRAAVEKIGPRHLAATPARTLEPVPPPIAAEALAGDISQLPAEAKLQTSGAFDIYCVEAGMIPHVLTDIGRLRERTFRAIGEGTGKPSDLDVFDQSYLHLFVWNREESEVVGAYRIGRSDQIVESVGVAGLYTRSLFSFGEELIRNLPPALELGRSFVREEYQRDPNALTLLWKGICAFVRQHPQYRVLFGAVSVSARYSERTRAMLMRFLEQNHLDPLSWQVAPLHPYPVTHAADDHSVPLTLDAADDLTSRIEGPGRNMPVLLRHYLKLNARVLGFSVDSSFGNALDALMMVDLLGVDTRILRRYFGRQGADAFVNYHLVNSHAA